MAVQAAAQAVAKQRLISDPADLADLQKDDAPQAQFGEQRATFRRPSMDHEDDEA